MEKEDLLKLTVQQLLEHQSRYIRILGGYILDELEKLEKEKRKTK